jgi:ribosome-binding protein aMBF1 (putative translation factor)
MARERNALHILKKRIERDTELQELVEDERVNLQVALAIREAREAARLTQKELAEMIGTTQSVISRLEDADYEGHTLKTLERIAEALQRRVTIRLEPVARTTS